MKAYSIEDVLKMSPKLINKLKAEIDKSLNISPAERVLLSKVKKVSDRMITMKEGDIELNELDRKVEPLYDCAKKIIDTAIMRLSSNELTTWKSINYYEEISSNFNHPLVKA